MPTIDELAPATASADTDELPVNQNGVTRKVTRGQVLAGVQTQISLPGGTLLGRMSSGLGGFETIAIGNYLSLISGTLSGLASPYSIGSSPSGLVPAGTDLVPLGQGGLNVSVTYSTFFQGLSNLTNVDGSQLLVRPAGASTAVPIANLVQSLVGVGGGSLSGPLYLATNPALALQAATKQYADGKVGRAGDTLQGPLQLFGDPTVPLQAATKEYVDATSAFPRSGFTMTGPIILASDPTTALNPATKSYADGKVLRAGDTMTGLLTLTSDPISRLQAATKNYVDTNISSMVPLAGGTLTGPLTLSGDPVTPLQAATKQYTDTKLQRAGDTLSGFLTLAAAPTNPFHAATKGYVDSEAVTLLPISGGTMQGPIVLAGNPTLPAHASTKYYVDSGLAGALSISGGTLLGAVSLALSPAGPTNLTNRQYVDTSVAGLLPLTGGSMSGSLLLGTAPVVPLHAATKQYVDANPAATGVINVKLPPCGAVLNGVTDDTQAFITAYLLAPAGGTIYVPNGSTVVQPSGSWGVQTTKRVKWIVDGTTLANGTLLADAIPNGSIVSGMVLPGTVAGYGSSGATVSQGSSQSTDFSVVHSSYLVNHSGGASGSIISNARTDTIVSGSPVNDIWSTIDRLVWAGVQAGAAGNSAKQIGRYIQSVRESFGGTGSTQPQPLMWAGYLEVVDTTGQPSSLTNGSCSIQANWTGNGPDDAGSRNIQSLVLTQYNTSGSSVEVSAAVAVSLAQGSSGTVYRVFDVDVPYSISVLDTTGATQLSGAAAVRLGAGHAIAFEPTNTVNLSYSSTSGAILARYGSNSCAVGRGLSVSYGVVFGTTSTISPASAGCVIFLVGSGSYSINLPAAKSLAAGTGFTFSALGAGVATIVPAAGDTIDLSPVVLRQYDRYHIVSDGSSLWREIFHSNAVSPHFSGPPVLPSYQVAGLPAATGAGAKAFAVNGRKPGEVAGGGTGVEVFFDGNAWISVCSGASVAS